MRKVLTGVLTAAFLLTAGGTIVFAANSNAVHQETCTQFVDENNDGICDNAGTGCGHSDDRENKTCSRRSGNCPKGRSFADDSNPGVCENRAAGQRRHCGSRGNGVHGRCGR